MVVIITMAGQGRRFKKAGYNVPKFMIEAKGKTLFEWSIASLLGFREKITKWVFVVRKDDNAEEFIISTMKKNDFSIIDVLEIDYMTDGQATTAKIAVENCCNPAESIFIYNIDTYVEPYEMKYDEIHGDGFIPCFNGVGNHWSFVKTVNDDEAIQVAEKSRISDNCSIGAYYFSSAKLYCDAYDNYYSDEKNCVNGEKYIAPLYNYLISNHKKVFVGILGSNKVHVLGTPEELRIFESLSNEEEGRIV